ncbi:MAG: hypothetical protein IJI16_04120 [Atopobiaceae bacterium]|nr:hypothetical protein [Atopobiaceae bacterium]
MATRKAEVVKFEHNGIQFEAVKAELESYETNKQLAIGGPAFYLAVGRLFAGRDVEYSKKLGGTYDAMMGLVNAAFAAYSKAKN